MKKSTVLSTLRWHGADEVTKTAIKELAAEDVIPLGVEMWADRFHIKTRIWWSEDKQTEAKSFIITRRERNVSLD